MTRILQPVEQNTLVLCRICRERPKREEERVDYVEKGQYIKDNLNKKSIQYQGYCREKGQIAWDTVE